MKVKSRVEQGAQLLDRVRPGWEMKIRASKLDMSTPDCCILGQVFGDFSNGLSELGLSDGISQGFIKEKSSSWYSLKRAWLSLIKKRIRAIGL